MITWMQRHRKYLVITIWISTIAFIGAGFVGWGQYDYGDKAGAVAKVGNISITQQELQKSYTNLFNQYNQLFQGKLDEAKAKQFGLQRQALKNLVDQALILNLAQSYNVQINDEELLKLIKSQNVFTKNGQFNKQSYEEVLKQNHMSIKEYEIAMRRELLIQKTLYLFAPATAPLEKESLGYAMGVSDKVEYKLLTPNSVIVTADEAALKAYWEKNKNNFKNPANFELSVAHPKIDPTLKDEDAEKEALRRYIDFKKGSLDPSVTVEKMKIASDSTLFSPELLKEIEGLNNDKPYLKPRKVNNQYVIIKLEKKNPSSPKTYEEAKNEANIAYSAEMKKGKLQELAQNSYKTFSGTVSDFITRKQTAPLSGLSAEESSEFINKLFESKQKQGFSTLKSGNVILYNVLEQKLLQDGTVADDNAVMKLKGNLLNQKLLKSLESKYPVKIYVEGI
ncbi:MAG: peptidylprolyl isomerase [Sulfuricurvum sp.]|uniref:peptidylprolyl isomerase n=1 Tax=Sulfuricurvum sp. TaxID=2025608 RepID=UPI00261D4A43|nr:peptidylprolyl isomerase [Sulfuricurvum sp.]MDD2828832.1 peptidylprolyl isomerase [Sulfuricurvum sp.]MDD4948709.1 peptidylprolyl isomerase [Sulfuricurvum sp.]